MQFSFPGMSQAQPKFGGLQLIQVHGDHSGFKDHMTMRFVPYTPDDQVDLFNDKDWGDHSPGPCGTVLDNPTARYTNKDIIQLAQKIRQGEIPAMGETKAVIQKAINAAPLNSTIRDKFTRQLEKAYFSVKALHRVWQGSSFLISGYYGADGKLVDTFGPETYRDRLPSQWSPNLLNKSSPNYKKDDSVSVSFDTAPSFDEMPFMVSQH